MNLQLAVQIQQWQRPLDSCATCPEAHQKCLNAKQPASLRAALPSLSWHYNMMEQVRTSNFMAVLPLIQVVLVFPSYPLQPEKATSDDLILRGKAGRASEANDAPNMRKTDQDHGIICKMEQYLVNTLAFRHVPWFYVVPILCPCWSCAEEAAILLDVTVSWFASALQELWMSSKILPSFLALA